jgi:hypothetical protein
MMMMMIMIIIYFNLQSPYSHMNDSIYNSSSHYILLRECIYSVFMLIHLQSFYGFCFKI